MLLEIVGELGVNLFDFYNMTWIEWCNYSNGLHKAKIKEWEHTRTISWMIYKANSDPKKSAKNMLSWWRLPTDTESKTKRQKGRPLSKAKKLEFFKSMR